MKRNKYIRFGILFLGILGQIACSGSGGSGGDSGGGGGTVTIDPLTYGEVNLPATAMYLFADNDGSIAGALRLVDTNGIFVIGSTTANSNSFSLNGAVSGFASGQSQCLPPTTLNGLVANKAGTATVTLTNCSINNNILTATMTISSNGKNIYQNSVSMAAGSIASTSTVSQLNSELANGNPDLYNTNIQLKVNLSGLSSTGLYGTTAGPILTGPLFGNMLPLLLNSNPQTISYGGYSGSVTLNLVDSTSLNISGSNISGNNLASTSLSCNVIMTGLVKNNQLSSKVAGFVTNCSKVTTSSSYGTVGNVSGSFTINQ